MRCVSEESRKKSFRIVGIRSDGTRGILATGLPKHEALNPIRFLRANALSSGEPLPLEIAFEKIEIEEEDPGQPSQDDAK
jgi:hypothetical protein